MDFAPSSQVREFQNKLTAFMEAYVYPAEAVAHEQIAASGDPHHQPQARAAGLWNLFLPDKTYGAGLTNLEYAPFAEIMGRSPIAPEIFNCSAPDTGNTEILAEFGTPEQRRQWLEPLLAGESRSCFSMTEPEVASSDATNIQTRAVRDGDAYVITGRQWFTSNAYHPNCRIAIVMAVTDPEAPPHRRATMLLVPLDTPGFELVRSLPVFNYIGEGGHAEVRQEISMIKVVAANAYLDVLDRAIQVHGAMGITNDTPLALLWSNARTLRIVDGPDEVHKMVIARHEIRRHQQ